jgi:hypothetical protein
MPVFFLIVAVVFFSIAITSYSNAISNLATLGVLVAFVAALWTLYEEQNPPKEEETSTEISDEAFEIATDAVFEKYSELYTRLS